MTNYLKEGFQLSMTGEQKVTKEQLLEQKFVLYVYPKDNTPGCTLEANEFTEHYDEFKKLGFEIYGISKDSVKTHEKFKEKQCIPFALIADPDKELLEALDVIKEKKMYGKTVLGTVRSTFIFDKGLKLIAEFRDIKAQGHAEEVLNYIKENL